ncbi:alpha/beta hydrolase [Terriglobus aquaticus]|uniref:Alpha/beta hydrolase n=1 Tax=Terriglobus aquaticus TaxID=940139 RepID=A0ABW9KPJ8_9BACT|nr:alpha/beta hydrolase [Terriglobus aquaticus]
MWFLSCRTSRIGGDVGPVQVTDGYLTFVDGRELLEEVRGRDVLIALHGFNVHQAGAVDHFQQWQRLMTLGANALLVGGLWPGDSAWLGALEYAFAAKAAMRSGQAFGRYLNLNFQQVRSISFVSHSLGARVALRTIQELSSAFDVRRLILMAPAVDDDCLTGEFAKTAKRIGQVTVLGSKQDKVLRLAYPLGNPISGIFARGHPYWHAALGREGPTAYPSPNNIGPGWRLPDDWKVDHSDYLPPESPFAPPYAPAPFPLPMAFPAESAGTPALPQGYDGSDGQPEHWQCGWTAGWTSFQFP